jgi:type II secretory pathway predicted ATPase ExeA/septal ring-binding cell division protein DamX
LYYPHFGLKEPPFKITPNTDFFFSGGNRGAVLDALVYAISNGEGIIKVVGEVGSGKTMLCRMLQTILPEKIESIYLANPSVAPEDVLHAIAFELQLKVPKNADRLKVMQLLQAHLLSRHAKGSQVVIFVEEAQGMPLATLEEIRLLSNLETKQDKLLQIVLFGQPELDSNLSETHIRQLRERITHSFHLEPLGTKDIGEYLISRLRAAGYHGPHLFSDAAIKKLSVAAEGLARRVNILADKSLLAAYADNVYQVTPKHVKAAIQDSEFGRKTTNYKKYFIWLLLLISIMMGFLGYAWWEYLYQPKPGTVNQAVNTNVTMPSEVKESRANETAKEKQASANATTPAANVQNNTSTRVVSVNSASVPSVSSAPVLVTDSSTSVTTSPNSNTHITPTFTVPANSVSVSSEVSMQPSVEKPINKLAEVSHQSLADKRFDITKNLLASGQSSTITLQIKSLPTGPQFDAELERLSQQLEIDNVYLYHKKQNGEMYTVIVYGAFAQRSEALAALQNLPISIKNNKPYIRTFAGINRDIEQTQ